LFLFLFREEEKGTEKEKLKKNRNEQRGKAKISFLRFFLSLQGKGGLLAVDEAFFHPCQVNRRHNRFVFAKVLKQSVLYAIIL